MMRFRIILATILLSSLLIVFFVSFPYWPVRQPSDWPIKYPTAHFSVDDVRNVCVFLQNGEKESIFEEPLLARLKQWHEQYGAVASLYIQGPFVINSRYADEIRSNADWLRWGFHGTGKQQRKKGIGSFSRQIMDSIGTLDVMDKAVRIDYFHADLFTCLHYRLYGIKAFYTADNWRGSSGNYYLTSDQCQMLDSTDILYEPIHNITFIKTDLRVACLLDSAKQKNLVTNNLANRPDLLVFFSHECDFNEQERVIDSIFCLLKGNGYQFGFPF